MEYSGFLDSILYLLAAATLFVSVSKLAGLGSILGLLLTGFMVGPHSPGPILTENVEALRHITEFGIVLLLFVIGLEMKPAKLWEMRKQVFGLGSLQILATGSLLALYFSNFGHSWQVALLIGLSFALSSTAFVIQILQERGEFYTHSGQTAFSVLLMQDLAIVPLLALVPLASEAGQLSEGNPIWQQAAIAIALILLVILLGRYGLPKVLQYLARNQNREAFFFSILFGVVLSAWAMDHAGLSMALGAFLLGMTLSNSRFHYQIQAHVEPFKGMLMNLFFVGVGMSIDPSIMTEQTSLLGLHLLSILSIKIITLLLLLLLFGFTLSISTKVAFLLSQSGEFGFVLFGAAKGFQIISEEQFVMAITIISVSMLLTPILTKIGNSLSDQFYQSANPDIQTAYLPEASDKPVVIAGYGRVGRLIASMMEQIDKPYAAFDFTPNRVELGQMENRPVYYGDMSDLAFLRQLNLDRAEVVIIAIDDYQSTAKIVSHICSEYPQIRILSRARDIRSRDALLGRGATWALPESVEGSLRLGAESLLSIGMPKDEVEELLELFRKEDYETIRQIYSNSVTTKTGHVRRMD